MFSRLVTRIFAAGAVACLIGTAASAQIVVSPAVRAPYNFGYYGGGNGYLDPTFTVSPYGNIVPLGYGYNGYTGSGLHDNTDWEMLRSLYAQGYQDAVAQVQTEGPDVGSPTGMVATPRNAARRVPHGSDGVRMWKVGNGQIALRWQGDPRVASSVTFSITDKAGRTLRRTTVSQLPAEVRFTPPPGAVFYQVVVHYVDGANNTIMSRLPR